MTIVVGSGCSGSLWMLSAKLKLFPFKIRNIPKCKKEYERFMITQLFLPFFFFKVIVFDFLSLEHDSAAHDIVGVVHGILLLDFSFEVCDFLV